MIDDECKGARVSRYNCSLFVDLGVLRLYMSYNQASDVVANHGNRQMGTLNTIAGTVDYVNICGYRKWCFCTLKSYSKRANTNNQRNGIA